MILPFKKIPLRPIWPVLKRFGLTNVQLLNSCTGWTKHILRALPPTDIFGVAAFVWISLRGGCHPKGFWGTGGQVDVVHLPRMIPDFGTPLREHYHLCLARCWDHVVDTQIDVHKDSAIIVTILSWWWSYISTHHPSWDWGWTTNRPGYTIGVKIVSSVNFGVVRLSWLMKMAILRQNMCDVQCASDRNPEFCLPELFQIICIMFFCWVSDMNGRCIAILRENGSDIILNFMFDDSYSIL